MQKDSCKRATLKATSVNVVVGEKGIASMWKTHFERIYSSIDCSYHQQQFQARMKAAVIKSEVTISMDDIIDAVPKLKRNKAPGPDNITAEAFLYGTPELMARIGILFSLFLEYGYLPGDFSHSIIIPLVKNKSGDLTDAENYRAIMISNSITKLLELVLYDKLVTDSSEDVYQFGFKAKHSTGLCTGILKRTINYYTDHGSHVFCAFIDFSKAFDRVNYWHLFNKLLDDNVSSDVVRLLAFWYSHQNVAVRWHNTISKSFSIHNGTRQGSALSPYLFTRYIRDILLCITNSNIGCNIGGCMVNILAYADDLVLLAPSWRALQLLLDKLHNIANHLDMICNSSKTVCMVINPKRRCNIVAHQFPNFTVNNVTLKYVNEFKYLGHVVSNSQLDDADINRERKNLFYRCNMLMRRFSKCSVAVKPQLFKTFCLCFYDIGLWCNFTSGAFAKLQSAYVKCVKIFLDIVRFIAVSYTHLTLPTKRIV